MRIFLKKQTSYGSCDKARSLNEHYLKNFWRTNSGVREALWPVSVMFGYNIFVAKTKKNQ